MRLHGADNAASASQQSLATGIGILVIEPWIGPRLVHELAQRALESNLVHDLLDLGMHLGNLLEPQGVDIRRSHISCGELMDQKLVELVPVRDLPDAPIHSSLRRVLLQQINQVLVGRSQQQQQGGTAVIHQALLLLPGDRQKIHTTFEIRKDRAIGTFVERRALDHIPGALDQQGIDTLGHIDALGRLRRHSGGQLTEQRPSGGYSPDVNLRVRNGVQALLIDQDIGDLNMQPDNLIQRIERIAPAIAVEQQLRLVDKHPVLQLAGGIELFVREPGFDRIELVANGFGIGRQPSLRHIIPTILAYVLTELGGEDGTSLHDPVISVVEKRPETLRLGFLGLGRTTEDERRSE